VCTISRRQHLPNTSYQCTFFINPKVHFKYDCCCLPITELLTVVYPFQYIFLILLKCNPEKKIIVCCQSQTDRKLSFWGWVQDQILWLASTSGSVEELNLVFKLFSSIYTDCVWFGSHFSSNAKCFFVEFFPPLPTCFWGKGIFSSFFVFCCFCCPIYTVNDLKMLRNGSQKSTKRWLV